MVCFVTRAALLDDEIDATVAKYDIQIFQKIINVKSRESWIQPQKGVLEASRYWFWGAGEPGGVHGGEVLGKARGKQNSVGNLFPAGR